jgi:hypothetical protein
LFAVAVVLVGTSASVGVYLATREPTCSNEATGREIVMRCVPTASTVALAMVWIVAGVGVLAAVAGFVVGARSVRARPATQVVPPVGRPGQRRGAQR